jgi:hypothetical protein
MLQALTVPLSTAVESNFLSPLAQYGHLSVDSGLMAWQCWNDSPRIADVLLTNS